MRVQDIRVRDMLVGFAGALSLAGIVLGILWLLGILNPKSGPNSPIKIVGGSIKFKADRKWNASPTKCMGTPCIVSLQAFDVTQLAVDANQLTSLSSWIVTINVSNVDGSAATSAGAQIYPSDQYGVCTSDGNRCKASSPMYVSAYTLPAAAAYLVPESYDGGTSPHKRYRYRNPNCCNLATADYRETIYSITVNYSIGGVANQVTYPCTDGECNVYIGP